LNIFINVLQLLLAVLLIAAVLLQVKGTGGGLMGGGTSTFRTRRGLEKTLFQFTIILVILFMLVAIVNVRLTGRPF